MESLPIINRCYESYKNVNETRIFQQQAKLAEIGRMLGGWLRSMHNL